MATVYREIGPADSKFPLPAHAAVFTVTHEMAGDWLDYRCRPGTGHQRKMSPKAVKRYTDVMNAGGWRLTPQGLIFDAEGWCIDGQHRLQALRDSVLDELKFWVYPNEAADIFAVLDVGFVRQARQLYIGRYASAITSAVRYLGKDLGKYVDTMPPQTALDMVDDWPELVTHARHAQLSQQHARIPAAPHLAVIAQAERTEHRDMIPGWFDAVITGADVSKGDPRLQLRERFRNRSGRHKPEYVYNTVAKAWNLYATGDRAQFLTWRESEGPIAITGFDAEYRAKVPSQIILDGM